MIWTIAGKEWKTLMRSPMTWIALAIMQAVFAWLFLLGIEGWLQIQAKAALNPHSPGVTAWVIEQCFTPASTLILALSPLLTMRLIADERRGSGIELLLSSPLSPSVIVVGKLLAAFGVLALLIALLTVMPLSLVFFTDIDIGALFTATLGLLLFALACCAVGLYFSSLTDQAAVAALGAFGILFLLWVAGITQPSSGDQESALAYVSIAGHLRSFLSGLIDTADIAYYLLLCGLFISLAVRKIDNLRSQTR